MVLRIYAFKVFWGLGSWVGTWFEGLGLWIFLYFGASGFRIRFFEVMQGFGVWVVSVYIYRFGVAGG